MRCLSTGLGVALGWPWVALCSPLSDFSFQLSAFQLLPNCGLGLACPPSHESRITNHLQLSVSPLTFPPRSSAARTRLPRESLLALTTSTPSGWSTNSTSRCGSSPCFFRMAGGIVTWPLPVIFTQTLWLRLVPKVNRRPVLSFPCAFASSRLCVKVTAQTPDRTALIHRHRLPVNSILLKGLCHSAQRWTAREKGAEVLCWGNIGEDPQPGCIPSHLPHSAFRTPHSALRTPHSALAAPLTA